VQRGVFSSSSRGPDLRAASRPTFQCLYLLTEAAGLGLGREADAIQGPRKVHES
jgi:hypothetical protein